MPLMSLEAFNSAMSSSCTGTWIGSVTVAAPAVQSINESIPGISSISVAVEHIGFTRN